MRTDDPRRAMSFVELPILLRFQTFSEAEEVEVLSMMPLVPPTLNPEMKKFMDNMWELSLPAGYEDYTRIYGDDSKVVIDSRVILPSFDEDKAVTLADRIENFIRAELDIIKHGY